MSAYLQTPAVGSTHPRRVGIFDAMPDRQSLVVRASASFTVAPSRLFHALTIPEYIETWLIAPDTDEVSCTGSPTSGKPLSIELHRDRRVVSGILADYKTISAY